MDLERKTFARRVQSDRILGSKQSTRDENGSTNPASREPGYSLEGDVKVTQDRGYGIACNL